MPHALDEGPFFHGTVADLRPGDLLTAGRRSNYRPEIVMNHVCFTARLDGAALAAEIAAELAQGAPAPRVYCVDPTGPLEGDPHVTDKKLPGNPTRSFRRRASLRVLGEVTGWKRLQRGAMQVWRERLAVLLSSEGGQIVS
jgi:rifampin ADP-ribosylating transferase